MNMVFLKNACMDWLVANICLQPCGLRKERVILLFYKEYAGLKINLL